MFQTIEWIKTVAKEPPQGQRLLIFCEYDGIATAQWDAKKKDWFDVTAPIVLSDITHWAICTGPQA